MLLLKNKISEDDGKQRGRKNAQSVLWSWIESVNAALVSPGAQVEREQGEAAGFTVTEMRRQANALEGRI